MDEEEFKRDEQASQLIERWQAGDDAALTELKPIVHRELLRLANHYMSGDHRGPLRATQLAHEALTRLIRKPVSAQSSKHFLAVTAKLLRRTLVDHAKARGDSQSGGGQEQIESVENADDLAAGDLNIVAVDEALSRLQAEHPDAAYVAELQYFGGLTREEIAAIMEVSTAMVERQSRFAKAWLLKYLRVGK